MSKWIREFTTKCKTIKILGKNVKAYPWEHGVKILKTKKHEEKEEEMDK